METVKICTQRAVHMCWHFETPPQEFLAVYYKNRPLSAENEGCEGLWHFKELWKSYTHGETFGNSQSAQARDIGLPGSAHF